MIDRQTKSHYPRVAPRQFVLWTEEGIDLCPNTDDTDNLPADGYDADTLVTYRQYANRQVAEGKDGD